MVDVAVAESAVTGTPGRPIEQVSPVKFLASPMILSSSDVINAL